MRPPPQHTRWSAIVGHGNEERKRAQGMRLLPCSTVKVANSSRVLPLSRAWPALANGPPSAPPLRRPVCGYGYMSRPPRDHATSLGIRPCHGDRAAIRVWCSQGKVHRLIEIKSADKPACRLRQVLEGGKKPKTAPRGSGSLDNRGPAMWPHLSSSFY